MGVQPFQGQVDPQHFPNVTTSTPEKGVSCKFENLVTFALLQESFQNPVFLILSLICLLVSNRMDV